MRCALFLVCVFSVDVDIVAEIDGLPDIPKDGEAAVVHEEVTMVDKELKVVDLTGGDHSEDDVDIKESGAVKVHGADAMDVDDLIGMS